MARRSYGTGNLRIRRGPWYGQWRIGSRLVQRKPGLKREPGSRQDLTRKQAEAELRRRIESTEAVPLTTAPSIAEAGSRLVQSLEAQGREESTLAAYESTLRVHLVPNFGEKAITKITTEDVEAFIAASQANGCAPKSIRRVFSART